MVMASVLPSPAAALTTRASASSLPSPSPSPRAAASLRTHVGASCSVREHSSAAAAAAAAAHSLRWADSESSRGWRIVEDRAAGSGRSSSDRRARRRERVFASLRDAEELVRSGIVRPVGSKDAKKLLYSENYMLLDVRPIWERERAYVSGSYHVPLFVEDVGTGPLTFLKKGIQAGQGGWWLGLKLTTRNEEFVEQVEESVPEGQKLLVVCGEGLRSLLAVEELHDYGFEEMAWLVGGFNKSRDEDFLQVEGPTELRFAAVGGAAVYVLKFAILIQGLMNLIKGRQKSVDST